MKQIFPFLFAFASITFCASVADAQSPIIITVAGTDTFGYSGDGGTGTAAKLYNPRGVTVDGSGNIYIADFDNAVIRKVNTAGVISTVAGNGIVGYSVDSGVATTAELNHPNGLAVDAFGNIYIADMNNQIIRKVNTSGIITTVAGSYYVPSPFGYYSGDGGPATAAQLFNPSSLTIDVWGNMYIADGSNNVVREVNTVGIISTIAGNNTIGYGGDGGAATAASLWWPSEVALDRSGNIYIAEEENAVIRKVNTSGIISTVAGNNTAGYSGDGGAATTAKLNQPAGVNIDASGNIYIADFGNHVIREVNTAGIIYTVVGDSALGAGYSGDGGPATNAQLNGPNCVVTDSSGNIFIADTYNNRIRKVANVLKTSVGGVQKAVGNVEIYPNPVSDVLTIKKDANNLLRSFTICNSVGEVMSRQNISTAETNVNVKSLAAGVYYVTLKGESGVVVRKFVKE